MSKTKRFVPMPQTVCEATPFSSAEEAWFWFIRCQKYRYEGGRPEKTISIAVRPCDPDDIYRAVMALYRSAKLSAVHLRTLSQFGLAERAPDARSRDESLSARFWDEAMDFLGAYLTRKGIVE